MEEIAPGVFKKTDKTFYLKCTQTGKMLFCADWRLKKLVEKYGSLEEVGKHAISRGAKREQKKIIRTNPDALPPEQREKVLAKKKELQEKYRENYEINRQKRIEEAAKKAIVFVPQERKSFHLEEAEPDTIRRWTVTACHYPNIFLDNARWCNNCPLVTNCACNAKRVKLT